MGEIIAEDVKTMVRILAELCQNGLQFEVIQLTDASWKITVKG